MGRIEMESIVNDILPNEYNLATNNCCHFGLALWKCLTGEYLTSRADPDWVAKAIVGKRSDKRAPASAKPPTTGAKRTRIDR